MVQNPLFWENPRLILRLNWIRISGNYEWKKNRYNVYYKLFIIWKTIKWQKQHFLVKKKARPMKSQAYSNCSLTCLTLSKSRAILRCPDICVPFFSTEVVFISSTVLLLWICNIKRLHNLDDALSNKRWKDSLKYLRISPTVSTKSLTWIWVLTR